VIDKLMMLKCVMRNQHMDTLLISQLNINIADE